MNFTAKNVSTLRQMTGAGMMTCKEALLECDGDIELAKDWLRKKGLQQVDKKAGRETNAGLIGTYVYFDEKGTSCGNIVEVKCETDFVAKNPIFQEFVIDSVKNGELLKDRIPEVVTKVGENVHYGRNEHLSGGFIISSYVHNSVYKDNTIQLGTIGVLVTMNGIVGNDIVELARDIAMHIAAANPKAITQADIDPSFIEKERALLTEQALESGKPANIVEKMVTGKLNKILRDVCLLNQPFVKDMSKTVQQLLEENNAEVLEFIRFEIGE